VLPGESPCGRTNVRIRGWLGRADQATKVRGLFVHPHQVGEVAGRHPEILRARLVVSSDGSGDHMLMRCETRDSPAGLAERIAGSIRGISGLRATVELVEPGSLPDDGKVIDDRRAHV
jgi:phenylacetate-CoA ligase